MNKKKNSYEIGDRVWVKPILHYLGRTVIKDIRYEVDKSYTHVDGPTFTHFYLVRGVNHWITESEIVGYDITGQMQAKRGLNRGK